MKLNSKSEWLELEGPIGEPEIKWNYETPYLIERQTNSNGKITWFGKSINWVKKSNGGWTVLTKANKKNKSPKDASYQTYFAPCEQPIYEKLYIEMNS